MKEVNKKHIGHKRSDSWKIYRGGLFVIGLLLTGYGIYEFSTIFAFKSQLTKINGVVRAADIYVTTVTERRGSKSQKSELIFYISDRQQKFRLVKNIGNNYRDEGYERLLEGLKQSDSVTVWVKKGEIGVYEPKIFQIDTDNQTILEFGKVRTKNGGLALFLLLLGIGALIFCFWTMYPERFKKLLSNN